MKTPYKVLLFFAVVLLGLVPCVRASAPPPNDLALLVVPERVNLVQAGFELNQLRSIALVTYRTRRQTGEVILHGWTGREWIPVSLQDYATGDFMLRDPVRIILVGDEALLPGELVEASNWGPLVLNVEATQTDEFFNAMGQLFEFSSREWRQVANRHNMQMEDVTPASVRMSWYDQMTAARQQPERRRAPTPEPRPTPVPEPDPEPEPAPRPQPDPAPAAEPEVADLEPVPEPRLRGKALDDQRPAAVVPPPRVAPEVIWEPVELDPSEFDANETIK